MLRNSSNDRRRWIFLGILVAALCPASSVSAQGGPYMPGEIQIRLREGALIDSVNARHGTQTQDSLPPLYLLTLPEVGYEQQWIDRFMLDPDVDAAEFAWTDETPEGARQMVVIVVGGTIDDYLDQGLLGRLHIDEMQQHYTGAGALVAVLDTGVMASHEALAGCIATGGWDFVSNDDDPADEALGVDEDGDGLTDEGAGHGTMVAGILHVLAPDAQILPVRVLDDEGRGRVFDVAKGMRYAVDHGAQVINLSLGLAQHTFVIQDQIFYINENEAAIVSAAGNLATDHPPYYPASDPRALSIAALDSCDIKADFSNWHPTVDLSAPGIGILAPYRDGGYAIGAGTSFSVPFVSAQCAWALQAMPNVTLLNLYRTAREGVVDIYDIPENLPYLGQLGSGRIDGLATLAAIQSTSCGIETDVAALPGVLRAWPNPSRDGETVFLQPAEPAAAAGSRILILDLSGRCVGTALRAGDDPVLRWSWQSDGSALPGGVFFARPDGGAGRPVRLVHIR